MLWFKKQKETKKLIAVRPKNYRRIVLHAIEKCKEPNVWMDGERVSDFSEAGPLAQARKSLDFQDRLDILQSSEMRLCGVAEQG